MQETQRFVHDLLWAVNSPMLMNLTSHAPGMPPPLRTGDVDPGHLSAQLTPHRTQRVGRYFEQLIVYWIRFIRRCEVVAHALQLRDGKRTMGEIDLLFHDEQGRLTHWEIACKFYLQVNIGELPRPHYIGPNTNDTLQKKATRLLEHQLPLGARHFPEIEVRDAFVKGRIFYHWQNEINASLPAELAADHLRGRWMWAREIPQQITGRQRHYRILRKPFWLADEFASPSDEDVLTPTEALQFLENHFRNRQTPLLISEFSDSTSSTRETKRWFIVPNQWPEKADGR